MHLLCAAHRYALAGFARALRAYDGLQMLQPAGSTRRLEHNLRQTGLEIARQPFPIDSTIVKAHRAAAAIVGQQRRVGISSLEAMDDLIAINRRNYEVYIELLAAIPGLSLIHYDPADSNNYQYIVVDVDPSRSCLTRDELVSVLRAENVMARKYFWPGCHQMEPYRSLRRPTPDYLPETERTAARTMVLPTGQTVSPAAIVGICRIIRKAMDHSPAIHRLLNHEIHHT